MQRWVGAVAVAAAMLMAPAVAVAGEEDPALLQFKLPTRGEVHVFEDLGLSMDHAMEETADGGVIISAWVTDEELAQVRARGYEVVATVHDKDNIDQIRAEREQSIDDEEAAQRALKVNAAGKAGRSALPGTVRAQRADFYENNVGRFLSIEANTTQAQITCTNPNQSSSCTYTGPVLSAEWYDTAGNRMGGGNLTTYVDPDVNPRYYQYHYQIFRIGNKGDGGPDPASVKIAAPNGDVDTLPAKEWLSKNPPGYAANFLKDFNTRYYDSQESYKRMRDLAAEFPNISQVYDLPFKTAGYQRKAQTMLGYATTSYVTMDASNRPVGSTTSLSAANGDRAVVLTSKAWGHEGGNSLTAQLVDPGANNAPLTVSLNFNAIRVSLATNATGAITSTAAQVIDAINAHPDVNKIVTATKYRTSAAGGVVIAGAVSPLSDLLRAPSTFPRGPQTVNMLRIGKVRDGSKVGVFIYCQEHGNEIATSGVCLETAERLVRNYGNDPETTTLVDNLDIFVVPMINGDGGTHSLYDSNRRTNLANYCATGTYPGNEIDPASRNNWGVDLNRNFSQGSVFDGFQGATSADCTNGNFSGPFEFSEPETRNEQWIQSQFLNIKFANNIHSSGGYFMWPPGAYTPARVPLPYPPYGTLNYFDQTATEVLNRIKAHRGTAILPQKTGPVIDVLYSAAGNSADEAYYSHGIIGYDFEIGDTHYNDTGVGPASCGPGQQPPFGTDTTNNCLVNEGRAEGMEFSNGNYGLLKSALDYANDTAPPVVTATGAPVANVAQSVRFVSNEASSIYYTTDGSTPTTASTEYKPPRARALPLPVEIADDATLKWIAVDFKGHTSGVSSKSFLIDTVLPTATLTGFTEGAVFTQQRPVPVNFSCADETGGSGLASCVGSTSNGMLNTSTPGTFAYTVTARDVSGNEFVLSRTYTVLTATNVNSSPSGTVPATLSLTLGTPATFGAFTPGTTKTYLASTTANVVSTAGDAQLSVADPSATATGHLVNGAFSLPQFLQVRARNAANTGTAYNNVGSSASPLNLLTWGGPIANDQVTLEFSQLVNANDPLRTGAYSKALTFTLSTTTP